MCLHEQQTKVVRSRRTSALFSFVIISLLNSYLFIISDYLNFLTNTLKTSHKINYFLVCLKSVQYVLRNFQIKFWLERKQIQMFVAFWYLVDSVEEQFIHLSSSVTYHHKVQINTSEYLCHFLVAQLERTSNRTLTPSRYPRINTQFYCSALRSLSRIIFVSVWVLVWHSVFRAFF